MHNTTVKTLNRFALSLLTAAALCGCAGTAEPAQLTADNWQDYFELQYVPVTVTTDKNTGVAESDIGMEYTPAYNLVIRLKDEYQGKLDDSQKSKVKFYCELETVDVNASLKDGTVEFGDVVDPSAWESHGYTARTKENVENGTLSVEGYVLADDGTPVHTESVGYVYMDNSSIKDGYVIRPLKLYHDLVPAGDGGKYIVISDESVFAAQKDRRITWMTMEGTLYLK